MGIQLRGNQKDFNFQLHHRLSKFEVPVVVNLKHIFELFGLYTTCFFIQKVFELIRLSSDGQFWRKSQNKKGGKFELRSQLCYYNCKMRLTKNARNKPCFILLGTRLGNWTILDFFSEFIFDKQQQYGNKAHVVIFHNGFLSFKIEQPICSIRQHFFALSSFALKKLSWDFNFFHLKKNHSIKIF